MVVMTCVHGRNIYPIHILVNTIWYKNVDCMSTFCYVTLNVAMAKTQAAENWIRFGQWVAETRLSKVLTQEELADRVGLDRQQIYRIEKGGSTKRATVVKIAEALNQNPDHAISLAFGGAYKETKEPSQIDQSALAERAAEMIKGYLGLPIEKQNQILAIIKVLQSDRPELLNNAPIEITDADKLTQSDAEIDNASP